MDDTRVKSKTSLKAQLADYSKGACAQLERPGNAASIKNWVRYSAAAASALAAVAAADAGVIYSGLRNVEAGPNLDGKIGKIGHVDIDGDGLNELQIFGFEKAGQYGYGAIRANTTSARVYAVRVNSSFDGDAINFMSSQSVVPGGDFRQGMIRLATNTPGGNTSGLFENSKTGFAGFRFNPGDGDRYGWIRLRLEDTNNNNLTDKVTALDWAYESDIGMPIHVENLDTAVPEPSGLTIVGLAMGCVALPALRRRRQLQKAAENHAKE